MSRPPWSNAQLRLAATFLLLVLVPSLFLGWFSLRAVEAERRSRQGRVLENYQRYGEFAARAVRYELELHESGWQDLLPARAGWEERLAGAAADLDSAHLGERFVRAAYVLHADGEVRFPPQLAAVPHPGLAAPAPGETRLFEELRARAEAELDRGDTEAAAAVHRDILGRVASPRLQAIAWADLGRALLRAERWDEAAAAGERLLAGFPDALDLDNQPLRFVARLQIARAQAEKGDAAASARAILALDEDLAAHSDGLAASQYDFFSERAGEALAAIAAQVPPELAPALAARRPAPKKPAADDFWVQKLSRKLTRAVVDEQAWSPRVRYVSDVADGEPFLLAYVLLPDRSEVRATGLAGYIVDLPRFSAALLPRFLHDLELSGEAGLAVVDESGRRVAGARPAGAPIVTSSLGEPFEFWNVAVYPRGPGGAVQAVEFRTKVLLYVVLLLLLTILAGAVLVGRGVRREARLANLKTSFVSSVSHELRTPLTSIRMYAEMLEMTDGRLSDDERRRQLAVIRTECGRLERLIDAVLDFASLRRGTKRLRLEYEELGALVGGVAEGFRDQAESQGFHLEVEVAADLPEVEIDADAIRQVLLNLLSNAVKYSEDERWIAVRAYRREAEVALEVEDHGIGIVAAEQERIFADFYRVDQRLSSVRQGVGLGLTLARRLVEAHHGRVTVDSAPGRGSRFTVWLPVEPAAAPPRPARRRHVPQEA